MTISALSSTDYSALLTSLANSSKSTSGTTASLTSLGDQLLAELTQSSSASSSSSDSLLQELVSLSPAALGQSTTNDSTYNAQGLLQQVQSSLMLNDPLLQTDSTATGSGTSSDSLLQSLLNQSQPSGSSSNLLSLLGTNTSTQTSTAATPTTDSSANLAAMFKKDPALAGIYVQGQIEQGLLSMFE